MDAQRQKLKRRWRRHRHVRRKVMGTPDRPRLVVYRSLRHIYCQIVDDTAGRTLAATGTLAPEVRVQEAKLGTKAAATFVGARIGELARQNGVTRVVFDRNAYKYHGRVKELAEAARKAGLQF